MALSFSVLAPRRGACRVHNNRFFPLANAFATQASAVDNSPDSRYLNLRNAPKGFDAASAVVYPGFLTDEEGKSLIKEASKRLKRRRFENGHWDSVITGYREVELSTPDEDFSRGQHHENHATTPLFARVIDETRRHLASKHFGIDGGGTAATPANVQWLPCHAIDLSANGELSAHVDSVKFSGEIVAGISLLSDSIMRLRPSSSEWDSEQGTRLGGAKGKQGFDDSNGYVDLYLPRLSLYVLSGMSRYSYTHELLPSCSTFEFSEMNDSESQNNSKCEEDGTSANKNVHVKRERRLSIIFRDAYCNSNS